MIKNAYIHIPFCASKCNYCDFVSGKASRDQREAYLRLLEKEAAAELCRAFGKALRARPGWKSYILSSLENFENCFGRRADKSRRLSNGMIPCRLYMYFK